MPTGLERFEASSTRDPLLTIRSRTRPLHVQLESRMNLGSAFASRDSYMRLLMGYVAVYRPFEQRMDALPAEIRQRLEWPGRRKLPLLENDLRALGAPSGLQAAHVTLPDLTGLDAALGALYVIEGSCLGGQVISRMLHAALGLDRETGASFFLGYGELTGAMWKSFTALLRREVVHVDQASEAACAMFGVFEEMLHQT